MALILTSEQDRERAVKLLRRAYLSGISNSVLDRTTLARRQYTLEDLEAIVLNEEERDALFRPGNDAIWGEGNWIRCPDCPLDDEGREVYHHRDAHYDLSDLSDS